MLGNKYTASDQMLQCQARPLVMERRLKSNVELAPNCPRCASTNTKFCYYNNYSLSQPRYFCKGCRRYWTKGGSLRNVPVGGGSRKSRRAKAVRSSQNELVSSNITPVGSSLSPVPLPPGGSDGTEIDLAAVFAKFLNQNSGCGNSESVGSELPDESNELLDLSGSSNQETQLESNATREAVQLLSGLPQVLAGGDQIQEFPAHDPNSFGLQTMLSDELSQDLLWCDDATTLPDFAWQPVVQLQEFGSFSSDDDQSKISANRISDNWSLSDLSADEFYSRP